MRRNRPRLFYTALPTYARGSQLCLLFFGPTGSKRSPSQHSKHRPPPPEPNRLAAYCTKTSTGRPLHHNAGTAHSRTHLLDPGRLHSRPGLFPRGLERVARLQPTLATARQIPQRPDHGHGSHALPSNVVLHVARSRSRS